MDFMEQLIAQAQADFLAAADAVALENAKARYLGKSGQLTEQMKALGKLAPEQRKARGALINAAKDQIEAALNQRREALAQAQLQQRLAAEAIDVTLPGLDAFQLQRRLAETGRTLPIIFMTGNEDVPKDIRAIAPGTVPCGPSFPSRAPSSGTSSAGDAG